MTLKLLPFGNLDIKSHICYTTIWGNIQALLLRKRLQMVPEKRVKPAFVAARLVKNVSITGMFGRYARRIPIFRPNYKFNFQPLCSAL